jgi:hypothetical protein
MDIRLDPAARAAPPGWGRVLRGSAAVGACVLTAGLLGTLAMRGWGRVPFTVKAWPWYHSWPFYLFWSPRLDPRAAAAALPVALLAAAALVGLAQAPRLPAAVRLAGSAAAAFALALAVAALDGAPAAWRAPLAFDGEYPAALGQLGPIPAFLHDFAARVPTLPTFPAQHPPFATVFYLLVARVWPGLDGAAVATVAAGSLGVLAVAGLARDELGEAPARRAVACWALAPVTVLYLATSADAIWVPVLAGAVVAAERGRRRRSAAWTLLGGALLWLASMLTYAAVLLLPFLAVRAAAGWVAAAPPPGRSGGLAWLTAGRRALLGWAAATTAMVLGLAAGLWLATGYEPVGAVRSVAAAWNVAPSAQTRPYWPWVAGDLVAFTGALGLPLAAALVTRVGGALRARAFGSFELALLSSLLTAALWGHTRGEVERMWLFLVPFAVVVAVRQLDRWRAPLWLVGGLLLGQAVLVQMLFYSRW